jgi:hypothetical protein
MACWAFTCKHCQWVFTYSKIGETLADFIAEEKPKLAPEGVECICPHCKIFEYVGLEFTPLSKPFKTRKQAEKARKKYPERLRKRIGVGVIRTKS